MTLIIKKKLSAPSHEQEYKHMSWCIKNGIKIYIEPLDWRRVKIVINNNGKISRSEETFNQIKRKPKDPLWWIEIYKLYSKFYFEKHGQY